MFFFFPSPVFGFLLHSSMVRAASFFFLLRIFIYLLCSDDW